MVGQIFQVPLFTIDPKVALVPRKNQIGDDAVASFREDFSSQFGISATTVLVHSSRLMFQKNARFHR